MTLLVLVAAVLGKVSGSTLPARSSGLGWRESVGFGALMNTRGLTELALLGSAANSG
jgi:Kef-type K+ transport system membrane component KefB